MPGSSSALNWSSARFPATALSARIRRFDLSHCLDEGARILSEASPSASRSGRERRRALRVHGDLPLQVEARDARADARLRDISTAGLCCVFPEPIPEMTLVRIGVEFSGKRHDLEGAVVRCVKDRVSDGYEVAVFFTNLEDRARESLTGYITERQEAGAAT